jgi:hypothetical protein
VIPAVVPDLRANPAFMQVNQPVEENAAGGKSIYWTGGVKEMDGTSRGEGSFRFDMMIYDKLLGYDLTKVRNATLKTLEFPFKILAPFLVMIIASLLTRPNSKEALDRLYVRMKTPVQPDPDEDKVEMEKSYAEPSRFDDRKLFPNTQLEIQRPTPMDFWGFIACFAICFAIIGLVFWVAGIGA